MQLSPEKKLAAARWLALKKMPYFSSVLLGLRPVRIENMNPPTMAVTSDGRLLWCDEDLNKLSVAEVAASLLHEVGHVILRHHDRRAAYGADPATFNIAGDMEWNDDLREAGLKMFTMVLPEHAGFPAGKTAEWYYNELVKKESHGVRQPHCGSCSGHKHPQEPNDGDGGGQPNAQNQGGNQPDANGQSNAPAPGMTKSEMESMLAQAARDIKDAAEKRIGNVPGGLVRWADAQLAPPVVDWRRQLAQHVRFNLQRAEGEHDRTYAKPHRLQPALGYGPGRPLLARSVGYKQRILVAVDTSGSIGTEELNLFMPEIDAVLRAVNSEVHFVSCDARINDAGKINHWRDALKLLKGGGGTDFNPVFEYAKNMPERPTLVIFFTDGYGPAPLVEPHDMATIWLLTPSSMRPAKWGTYIDLKK
jgi:predicted metal-dependent peptidase